MKDEGKKEKQKQKREKSKIFPSYFLLLNLFLLPIFLKVDVGAKHSRPDLSDKPKFIYANASPVLRVGAKHCGKSFATIAPSCYLSQCFAPIRWDFRGEVLQSNFSDRQLILSAAMLRPNMIWVNPQLIRTLEDRKGTVETLTFSPDGQILASGGGNQDPRIRLWDMQTGEKIRTLRGHQTRVLTVAIAPDNQTLVSGSDDSMLNIWNLKTGELSHTFWKPATNVTSLAISPDGKTLASGDLAGLKLWDLTKQRPLKTLVVFDSIYSVAISPNGQLLASGSQDTTVKVWNLYSGELIGTLRGHTKPVNTLAFTPDSRILVTGSSDTTIKLWNVATGKLLNTLFGHASQINSLAINPDGQTLASAGNDGIRIWDLSSGWLISKFSGHSDWVRSLVFSPDGLFLASGGFDTTIKIWQAETPPPQECAIDLGL